MKKFLTLFLVICLAILVTACNEPQKPSDDVSSEPEKVKVDNNFVYNWLLENGQLQDGTKLVYTVKTASGELTLTTEGSKAIWANYQTKDDNGYNFTCRAQLFQEGKTYEFFCTIMDDEQNGVSKRYSIKKAEFIRNSPISNEHHDWFHINDYNVSCISIDDGKPKYERHFITENGELKSGYEEIPDDIYSTLMDINKNFSAQAQKHFCSTLDALGNGFYDVLGITLYDLGFDSFKVKPHEDGGNSQSKNTGTDYNDM